MRRLPLIIALLAFGIYIAAVNQISTSRRHGASPELLNTMPWPMQILFAGGDRYLAANLNGFRALVATTANMNADDYLVLARLQTDLSILNPRHEDNYYIAEAILPWVGAVDETQTIELRAAVSRPMDWLPYFYYGFNRYHFFRDPSGGAAALREALLAAMAGGDEQDAIALQMLALRWVERGYSAKAAAGVVAAMAATSPPGAVKNYLHKRAQRLEALSTLRSAADRYRQLHGRAPASLDDLIGEKGLKSIPEDPFGVGFALDKLGVPVLRDTLRAP